MNFNNEQNFLFCFKGKLKEEIEKINKKKSELYQKKKENKNNKDKEEDLINEFDISNTYNYSNYNNNGNKINPNLTRNLYNKYEFSSRQSNYQTKEKFSYRKILANKINKQPIFDDIDKIILNFQDIFKEISKKKIVEILGQCSFNLVKAYESLNELKENRNRINFNKNFLVKNCFTSVDDYIIKYMQNCEIYEKLIEEKGVENIKIRRMFLKLDK